MLVDNPQLGFTIAAYAIAAFVVVCLLAQPVASLYAHLRQDRPAPRTRAVSSSRKSGRVRA